MDWASWIAAIATAGTVLGALIIMVLKNYFVTRAEFQRELEKREKLDDARHNENVGRLTRVESVAGEVREMVARIDGELSGRRKRLDI